MWKGIPFLSPGKGFLGASSPPGRAGGACAAAAGHGVAAADPLAAAELQHPAPALPPSHDTALPKWFAEDERKFMRPVRQVSAAEYKAAKDELR